MCVSFFLSRTEADVDSLAHFNLHCRIIRDIVSKLKHNKFMKKTTEIEFTNS